MQGEEILLTAWQSRGVPGGSISTPNAVYVTNLRIIFKDPRLFGLKARIVDAQYRDISNVWLKESGGLQGGVLEKATTSPNLSQSMGQKFGGLLQSENNLTFSQKDINSTTDSDDKNNTLSVDQSDSVSHAVKKATRAADDGVQEQDDTLKRYQW